MEKKQQTGVWIDGSKAVIVTFLDGTNQNFRVVEAEIENKVHNNSDDSDKGTFMGWQHLSHEKTFDERKKQQTNDYLGSIIEQLNTKSELLIFGPGKMKIRLNKKIEEENNILRIEIKKVETTDKMTDNQIIAHVKQHFNIN